MKRIVYILFVMFVFFGFSACKSTSKGKGNLEQLNTATQETNPKEYLKLIGTEPFWNISVSEDKIVYTQMEGKAVEFPYNIPDPSKNENERVYRTVNGKGTIRIQLLKQDCSDGMSDKVYPYKALVEMTQMNKITKISGCATYLMNKDFDGKWMLSQINNKKVVENDQTVIPFLDFDIENNRVSGNAGCNGLSSLIWVENKNIKFSEPILTKMFCEDLSMEETFVKTLKEITNYKIQGARLNLYKGESLEMIFTKQ